MTQSNDQVPANLPSYYAVISAPVRYNKKLCANAKLLFAEITALCNHNGYCWANNYYFANLFTVETRTIQRWIIQLEELGFIYRVYQFRPGTNEKIGRHIYLGNKAVEGGDAGSAGVVTELSQGGDKKVTHNNIKANKQEDINALSGPARVRGTRIHPQFSISDSVREWAKTKAPDVDLEDELEVFINYWSAVPGKQGSKADWDATFRNSLKRKQSFIDRDKKTDTKKQKHGTASKLLNKLQTEGSGDSA